MTSPNFISFPKDFLWGAATSSFQIEGSPLADGAVESDWYRWTKTPGKIVNGDTADVALDHYHRVKEDVALMKKLGLQSYRFSISWARVMPQRGRVNEKAIDFYRALMEELQQAGIIPLATLYHWETPIWAAGGWENRETVYAFEEYARVVFERLGSYAPFWATINEPLVIACCGYMWGWFPPGKTNKSAYGQVTHHLNLAHGLAVRAFRQFNPKSEIGPVMAVSTFDSLTEKPEDMAHARRLDDIHNGAFLGAVAGKGYPKAFFDFTGKIEGPIDEDLKIIQAPVDFVGVNHYFRNTCKYKKGANIVDNENFVAPGTPLTDMDWEVRPKSFGDVLSYVWETYGFKKIYVTENGMATRISKRTKEEFMADDVRIHYIGTYLAEAQKAIARGVPLKGYFAWSLMDNFEWAEGFDPAFGLIAVDLKTQERTFKKSAYWYKKLIAQNGFDLSELPSNPNYFKAKPLRAEISA
jgi:beta-glucosidase